MRETNLHANWTFQSAMEGVGYWRPNQPANPWRPAVVPGCIHDDLIRAGVIADPFLLEHEAGCQWVSEEDWVYRTTFSFEPNSNLPRRVIRFEGLDTVCTVSLNDEVVAEHDNMFLPLEVDVTDRLIAGENTLQVVFRSPVRVGMERRKAYFEKHGIEHGTNWFDERSFVRKVQCMSGWDWGPRLVSCGIWQPVRLLEFQARVLSFDVFQERQPDGRFRVWSVTEVEGAGDLETEFDGKSCSGDFDITIDSPQLWWPHGEGKPYLYTAKARTGGCEVAKRIGLRTIRLIQEPDSLGTTFHFEVNGRAINSRGANWIPNDSFPSRITDEDYREQVETCAKLNMNMLRVWGGGLYEQEGFYDACDDLGILVWQDFPFACSYYPDDLEHQELLAVEGAYHVKRLRHRASLAIWCGNNENDVMWEGKWGGVEKAPPRYFGDNLYALSLAEVCAKLDPTRPYVRSSPIGGQAEGQSWGDSHYWDVWHGRGDWRYYSDSLTRFSSEFGFASACGEKCWNLASMDPEELARDSGPARWHDKTNKPWEIYRDMVELHYPSTSNLAEWTYVSQLNQRDALRFGIEHYRTNRYCAGTLIWQFNDCWPVQSWAVQDYAREIKPAGFELARLYAARLISVRVEEDAVVVSVANDGCGEAAAETLTLDFIGTDGAVVRSDILAVPPLAAGARRELARVSISGLDANRTILACGSADSADPRNTYRTLAEPKDMDWIAPKFSLTSNLELQVVGLAYDMVVEDPDDTGNVQFAGLALPGSAAKTVVNGTVALKAKTKPKRVRVRTLSGVQILDVQQP